MSSVLENLFSKLFWLMLHFIAGKFFFFEHSNYAEGEENEERNVLCASFLLCFGGYWFSFFHTWPFQNYFDLFFLPENFTCISSLNWVEFLWQMSEKITYKKCICSSLKFQRCANEKVSLSIHLFVCKCEYVSEWNMYSCLIWVSASFCACIGMKHVAHFSIKLNKYFLFNIFFGMIISSSQAYKIKYNMRINSCKYLSFQRLSDYFIHTHTQNQRTWNSNL